MRPIAYAEKSANVILITIDCLRADHLGCYGYQRNTSPYIDKLASNGVVFQQAIAQSSHTVTSFGSIFTSTLPATHLFFKWGSILNAEVPTLAEVLKHQGYATLFVCSDGQALKGFNRGFDQFLGGDIDAFEIVDKMASFIKQYPGKPFFIWAHYMPTHAPYYPVIPRKYKRLFRNDALSHRHKTMPVVPYTLGGFCFEGIPDLVAKPYGNVNDPDYFIAQYDRAIRFIDHEISRIGHLLKKKGLEKNTMLIITADHGELFGEHGYYFHHGWFLYEPLLRVPLIFSGAGITSVPRRLDCPVSAHLSLAPTIIDIAGAAKPEQMEGVSLLNALRNGAQQCDAFILSDEGFTVKSVRNKDWKLIYNSRNVAGPYELYDIKEDPQELYNLYPVNKDEGKRLQAVLDAYEQKGVAYNKREAALEAGIKERLKSLGYAQ
jgi:arylsulfatase A-like enzyme